MSEYKCIKVEQNKIVSKYAEKLLKYRILFKDIVSSLGIYINLSAIVLYL